MRLLEQKPGDLATERRLKFYKGLLGLLHGLVTGDQLLVLYRVSVPGVTIYIFFAWNDNKKLHGPSHKRVTKGHTWSQRVTIRPRRLLVAVKAKS